MTSAPSIARRHIPVSVLPRDNESQIRTRHTMAYIQRVHMITTILRHVRGLTNKSLRDRGDAGGQREQSKNHLHHRHIQAAGEDIDPLPTFERQHRIFYFLQMGKTSAARIPSLPIVLREDLSQDSSHALLRRENSLTTLGPAIAHDLSGSSPTPQVSQA
jgi:hypothetical protein